MYPRGSVYTPIMELGSQNHRRDGLLGPNSIVVVCMDPLCITRVHGPIGFGFGALGFGVGKDVACKAPVFGRV